MVRVFRHGNRIAVNNPVNPAQTTYMVDVTFVEVGRRGGNYQLSDTSHFIDKLLADEGELGEGETTGLDLLRIHTQPIRENKLPSFPIGKEFRAFINRTLYSTPQMRQQNINPVTNERVLPRMIDGRPTFFTTVMEDQPRDDRDLRIDNNELIKVHPEYFTGEVVSQSARVDVTDRPSQEEMQTEMTSAMANHPLADLRAD
jgi:hypothetical protein